MKLEDHYKLAPIDNTIKCEIEIDGDSVVTVSIVDPQSLTHHRAQERYRMRMYRATKGKKELFQISPYDGDKEPTEELYKLRGLLMAERIAEWSFEDELTIEKASQWLITNPDVLDALELQLDQAEKALKDLKKN